MKMIKILSALIASIGLSYFSFADRTVTQNQVKQVVPVMTTNIVENVAVVTTNGYRNPLGIINESVTYFSSATSNTIASVAATQITNDVAPWAMSGQLKPGGAVESVNNKTGIVNLVAADVGACSPVYLAVHDQVTISNIVLNVYVLWDDEVGHNFYIEIQDDNAESSFHTGMLHSKTNDFQSTYEVSGLSIEVVRQAGGVRQPIILNKVLSSYKYISEYTGTCDGKTISVEADALMLGG